MTSRASYSLPSRRAIIQFVPRAAQYFGDTFQSIGTYVGLKDRYLCNAYVNINRNHSQIYKPRTGETALKKKALR